MEATMQWTTTLVGQMPRGENKMIKEIIDLAAPLLWEVGGTDKFRFVENGFHVTLMRGGANEVYLGDFSAETRSAALDLGRIRALTGAKWRTYAVSILAHEMVHARQFLRSPKTYERKWPSEFATYEDYHNNPSEVEARAEESLVRQALGLKSLPGKAPRGRRKERLDRYRQAFECDLLPILRVAEEKSREEEGAPAHGFSLTAAKERGLLADMGQFISARRMNAMDATTRTRAAKLWRYARGWHIETALEGRTREEKPAWLENKMVQRCVAAHLEKYLPGIALDMARKKWETTPHSLFSTWQQNEERPSIKELPFIEKGRLVGIEQIYTTATS